MSAHRSITRSPPVRQGIRRAGAASAHDLLERVQSAGNRELHAMAIEKDALRDWHRLFGLLLADFFAGSPYTVEVERDLSEQQQFLDVVIVRRGRGRFHGRLPDGLEGLAAHNLITFKSHHEALDAWAMKELVDHCVAYRKLASRLPLDLLPEEAFRLYAVCARFPHNLARQVPWQERQTGVYDCKWGTDEVRVLSVAQLPREAHHCPSRAGSRSSRSAMSHCGKHKEPGRSHHRPGSLVSAGWADRSDVTSGELCHLPKVARGRVTAGGMPSACASE
jgi:hypothetical protein